MRTEYRGPERRRQSRFGINRELRYKLVTGRTVVATGTGHTVDIGSCGVAFSTQDELKPGTLVELSISWPALLNQTCPMRFIVFGRLLRGEAHKAVCTVDKYEFRTARTSQTDAWVRQDNMLERWAGRAGAIGA